MHATPIRLLCTLCLLALLATAVGGCDQLRELFVLRDRLEAHGLTLEAVRIQDDRLEVVVHVAEIEALTPEERDRLRDLIVRDACTTLADPSRLSGLVVAAREQGRSGSIKTFRQEPIAQVDIARVCTAAQ